MRIQRPFEIDRRRLGQLAGVGILGLLLGANESDFGKTFDHAVEEFMRERKIPGGALAVVKDRRLVYAKGYGFADREAQTPATEHSLFRIASVSKPITGVALMRLIEEGRLKLDDRAFPMLDIEPFLEEGAQFDARLNEITIEQLLTHTGGWDRDKSFDAMFRAVEIAKELGVEAPAKPGDVLRYMLGKPLDFSPGERYAYSNLGYCVLGRIIEKLTGATYEDYVREQVLKPCGIETMRIGRSLDGAQAEGEVRYYMEDDSQGSSVFPSIRGETPWPYGAFHLEAMDAHGGWIASAHDLARFAAALGDPEDSPILAAASVRALVDKTSAKIDDDVWYGRGWFVRAAGPSGGTNSWHTGSLPGTFTLLVRRWDGLNWVVLFNQRSQDKSRSDRAIDPALHEAADAVAHWPEGDLFGA